MKKVNHLDALKATGTTKKHGTYVRFYPDPEIFQETTDFSFDTFICTITRTCIFK